MRRAQREVHQVVMTQAPVNYITGWTPIERADDRGYYWDYYPMDATPDPRYTTRATPTNVGYVTRGQYEVWRNPSPDTFAGRAYELYEWWRQMNADRELQTIREMEEYIAQEREHERAIEEALEQYDTLRERMHGEPYGRGIPEVANGVTLVSEREYARMEREWRLDPTQLYYTYPDTDDGLTAAWTERHPKIVKITYFIE